MEQVNKNHKNKGGRPAKEVTKDQRIPIKCTSYEKTLIQAKAKKAGLSVSEYLLELGLTGKIDSRLKTLPKEVLNLAATINHIAVNLNQLTKKHNSVTTALTTIDRVNLLVLCKQLKDLASFIKSYLQ